MANYINKLLVGNITAVQGTVCFFCDELRSLMKDGHFELRFSKEPKAPLEPETRGEIGLVRLAKDIEVCVLKIMDSNYESFRSLAAGLGMNAHPDIPQIFVSAPENREEEV